MVESIGDFEFGKILMDLVSINRFQTPQACFSGLYLFPLIQIRYKLNYIQLILPEPNYLITKKLEFKKHHILIIYSP